MYVLCIYVYICIYYNKLKYKIYTNINIKNKKIFYIVQSNLYEVNNNLNYW